MTKIDIIKGTILSLWRRFSI